MPRALKVIGVFFAMVELVAGDDLRAIFRYLRTVPAVDVDPGPSLRSDG